MRASLFLSALLFAAVGASPAAAADYAPIDCAKASTSSELAICKSYTLGQSEAHMATLFGIVSSLVAMGQRGDIGDAQRVWLKRRDQCDSDISCITAAYKERISALSAAMDGIAKHGPF
jgi:uncharacterized protein